jgi:hypothetical protein
MKSSVPTLTSGKSTMFDWLFLCPTTQAARQNITSAMIISNNGDLSDYYLGELFGWPLHFTSNLKNELHN